MGILEVKNVTKRFGGLVAVSSVDFTIPENSIVSLIGPNGAGKTTFFNIIAGIYDPTGGEIEFSGRRMIAHSRRAWLEPVVWVLPAAIVALFTIILGFETATTTSITSSRGIGSSGAGSSSRLRSSAGSPTRIGGASATDSQ